MKIIGITALIAIAAMAIAAPACAKNAPSGTATSTAEV